LSYIVEKEKIDLLYMYKGGLVDTFTPNNVKTGIHCVFDMREPHGSVYAGLSEWLAKFFNKDLFVPLIVNIPKTNETLHDELGVPKNNFVIGRLGGYDQFDIPIAHNAIKQALEKRSDLWAIFINTKPFIDHPRVKFIPFQSDRLYKSKFINTCDAMIHARSDGETFGLAVAEFSSLNKPVITYDANYWWYMRAHIHMLGDRAILYKTEEELMSYLLQIDKAYVSDIDWDRYSIPFSQKNVINKFNEVFIK
jgi:glycosyltransferase involved in cell wall biosynthesis